MIIDKKPLSMAEAFRYIKSDDDSETDIVGFIKKFVKPKKDKAEEIRKSLETLESMKIKGEHITKVIDLMPETKEELNKIFVDVSLEEDEIQKILNIIKEFK